MGFMTALDNLAPGFNIKVAGQDVGDSLTALVDRLEYESVDGMADVIKLTVKNPEFLLTDKKILKPGNEIQVWFGYGNSLSHIGNGIIVKVRPSFPKSGYPTLTVVAYTKDYQMMDSEPEESQDRVFVDFTYDQVVDKIATRYKMEKAIDITEGKFAFTQKASMSDYELVKGLANITGFLFWVDGDENGRWTLHFHDPEVAIDQERKYTFVYNEGNDSSLLTFEPELAIKGSVTKIKIQTKNTVTGTVIEEEIEVTDAPAEVGYNGRVDEDILVPTESPESVKLFIGEYSFSAVPQKRFSSDAEAKAWAAQWFRRNRENWILARGETIGLETLRARQVHAVQGIGTDYDGDYYFTRVSHIFSNSSGYLCNFNARKVL